MDVVHKLTKCYALEEPSLLQTQNERKAVCFYLWFCKYLNLIIMSIAFLCLLGGFCYSTDIHGVAITCQVLKEIGWGTQREDYCLQETSISVGETDRYALITQMNVWTANWEVLLKRGSFVPAECKTAGLDLIGKSALWSQGWVGVTWETGWGTSIPDQKGAAPPCILASGRRIPGGPGVQGKLGQVWCLAERTARCQRLYTLFCLLISPRLLFYPLSLLCVILS